MYKKAKLKCINNHSVHIRCVKKIVDYRPICPICSLVMSHVRSRKRLLSKKYNDKILYKPSTQNNVGEQIVIDMNS